jgi:hypothetical protein
MATFILEGNRINEGAEKGGAVFYNSTDGLAFGPVFDSAQDAESFMSFIRVDPSHLDDWNRDPEMSRAQSFYKLWLECGKQAKRPVVQLDADFLHERDEHKLCHDCDALSHADDASPHCDCGADWGDKGCEVAGEEPWSVAFSLTEHCFPLFLGYNNNDLLPVLKKHKVVIPKEMSVDTEHSCFYAYFKTSPASRWGATVGGPFTPSRARNFETGIHTPFTQMCVCRANFWNSPIV